MKSTEKKKPETPLASGLVGVTVEVPPLVRKAFKIYAAEKGHSMQTVLAAYMDKWIAWAKEGGPEPGIVTAERPAPPTSTKVLRSARATVTTLQTFVHELEKTLEPSKEMDDNVSDEPKLRRVESLLAELAAALGGKYEPGVGGQVERTPGDDGESPAETASRYLQERKADRKSKGSDPGGHGSPGGTGTGGPP